MGLGYLQQQPVELAFEDPLEALSVMPEEMPLMFPRGSNSPIPIAQIPDDTGTPDAATGVMIIGFLTRNGQGNNFTPTVLKAMFEAL